ncbi:hypothetical protein [Acrocarpospora sp. B8E8]
MTLNLDPEVAAALAPMGELDSIAPDADVSRRAIADRVRVLKSL